MASQDDLRAAFAAKLGFELPPPPKRFLLEEKYGAAPDVSTGPSLPPRLSPPGSYVVPTWYELAEAGEWPLNPYSLGLTEPPGGGGGGRPERTAGSLDGGGAPDVTWSETYQLAEAPEWWQGKTPSHWTPESEYLATMNAMLPYLSPEDQRSVASSLARMDPTAFGVYNPETVPFVPPAEVTTEIRRQFQGQARAQSALGALSNMLTAAGQSPESAGPGYAYMRQVADVLKDYGGPSTDSVTATNIRAMLGALDPLLAEAKGNSSLAAFEPLARMFSQPYFSAGRIYPTTKLPTGQVISGELNPRYF